MTLLPKDRRSLFDDLVRQADLELGLAEGPVARRLDTPARFAYAAYAQQDLNWIWGLLIGDEALRHHELDEHSYSTSFDAASLRRLWDDC